MRLPENMGATAICSSLLRLVPPLEAPALFWDVWEWLVNDLRQDINHRIKTETHKLIHGREPQ